MNLYVGNLSFDCTETDLQTAFAAHGAVDSARIISDRDTGRSKGFGFVEMPNDDEARKAIDALNGVELVGRQIRPAVPVSGPGVLPDGAKELAVQIHKGQAGRLMLRDHQHVPVRRKVARTDQEI